MAKSPFYRVVIADDDTEITNRITKLKFEDSVEEDNLLVLNIDRADNEFIDYMCSKKEKDIKFQYGFIGGEKTLKRIAKIKNVEPEYGKSIKLKITCFDYGPLIKKQTSNSVFNDSTSSAIVGTIAREFGMESVITETKEKRTFPVANKTYFEFIKKLAKIEGFDFFIKDNVLHFKPRDLTVKSNKIYEYGLNNGNIIKFKPKYEDKGESSKVSSGGIDNETGELFEVFAIPEETNEAGLGKKYIKYDTYGNRLGTSSESGSFENNPDDNSNRVQRSIDKTVDDSLMSNLTAILSVQLDATVKSEDIITIAGVAKEHSGNWYVSKKVDIVGKSGGITDLHISRNATNNKNSGDGTPKDVNNTIGDKNTGSTVEPAVRKYDTSGTQIN